MNTATDAIFKKRNDYIYISNLPCALNHLNTLRRKLRDLRVPLCSWVGDLFSSGRKRQLESEDLFELHKDDHAVELAHKLEE